jgi:porphobilinogen synthase
MVGQFQLSIDHVIEEVKEAEGLGIPGVILFGIPERKDEMGTEAYSDDGIIQRAVRAIKEEFPDFLVITDVCLCEYTSHGHCGVVEGDQILNDPTLELLAKQALSHARAGADMVAPSDMMDGRVGVIRRALDENGYSEIPIMAYSAKFSSAITAPSGKRRNPHLNSGTGNPIRWILATPMKPSEKFVWTSRKELTSSWLSLPFLIWTSSTG